MIELGFAAFYIRIFIVIRVVEHKQRIETLKFEAPIYRRRHRILEADAPAESNTNEREHNHEGNTTFNKR